MKNIILCDILIYYMSKQTSQNFRAILIHWRWFEKSHHISTNITNSSSIFTKVIFPGSGSVLPISWTGILDLSHYPVWVIWLTHDDVIKWKHFPRYWPFVRGIHRSPVNSPHKGQWRGALMFSLICVWINNCVKNREAGDLRRYPGHYDVIVICDFSKIYQHYNRISTTFVYNGHNGLAIIWYGPCLSLKKVECVPLAKPTKSHISEWLIVYPWTGCVHTWEGRD